jgi:hypothetical protein
MTTANSLENMYNSLKYKIHLQRGTQKIKERIGFFCNRETVNID